MVSAGVAGTVAVGWDVEVWCVVGAGRRVR